MRGTVQAIILLGLIAPAADARPTPREVAPAKTTACRAATGGAWSIVRRRCIRLADVGIQLDPVHAGGKRSPAWIVFAGDDPADTAELFLPLRTLSIRLAQDRSNGAGRWYDGRFELIQWRGQMILSDRHGTTAYQGPLARAARGL